MINRYVWRELTDDGLLKATKEYGPYCDRDEFKNSYDTEEEAVADYERMKQLHEYAVPSTLVLITTYSSY